MLERAVGLALCAALVLSACSPLDEDPGDVPQEETTPSGESGLLRDDSGAWVVDLGGRCRCEPLGATVRFPSGWSSLDDGPGDRLFFDPHPFDEADVSATDPPRMAIQFEILPKSFEKTVESLEPGTEVSRRRVSLHGREALVVEKQSAGSKGLGTGSRTYAYYLPLEGEKTLHALTHQLSGLDYEHNKVVLDAMLPAIEFDPD